MKKGEPGRESGHRLVRQDLRLRDNLALQAAVRHGGPIAPLYIQCDAEEREFASGGVARWWLHRSLSALDADLRSWGSRLSLLRGPALECLRQAVARIGATAVFWNQPAHPLAGRRSLVLGYARRRGPGGEHVELAMGRRLVAP